MLESDEKIKLLMSRIKEDAAKEKALKNDAAKGEALRGLEGYITQIIKNSGDFQPSDEHVKGLPHGGELRTFYGINAQPNRISIQTSRSNILIHFVCDEEYNATISRFTYNGTPDPSIPERYIGVTYHNHPDLGTRATIKQGVMINENYLLIHAFTLFGDNGNYSSSGPYIPTIDSQLIDLLPDNSIVAVSSFDPTSRQLAFTPIWMARIHRESKGIQDISSMLPGYDDLLQDDVSPYSDISPEWDGMGDDDLMERLKKSFEPDDEDDDDDNDDEEKNRFGSLIEDDGDLLNISAPNEGALDGTVFYNWEGDAITVTFIGSGDNLKERASASFPIDRTPTNGDYLGAILSTMEIFEELA